MIGPDRKQIAATFNHHAHRASAFKLEAMYRTVRANAQVQTMPGRVQVPQGRTPPHAVVIVVYTRANSRGFGVVVIRAIGKASHPTGVVQCELSWMPILLLGVVDKDWPICAVVLIAGVHIRFDLAKIGLHLIKAPLVVAEIGPGLEILGNPSVERRGVNGAGTAGHLAPRHDHGHGLIRSLADKLPIVRIGSQRDRMAAQGALRHWLRRRTEAVFEQIG